MATVILTFSIMPTGPEVDMNRLESQVKEKVTSFTGETEMKAEVQPVAFGLKRLVLTFVMDESKGGTDELEKDIAALDEVNSCECTDVRRAIG